eukprot:TRINITY_DN10391_c0_g1_i1.p1 TRINITY_DN10391_c0_g1~~TRINITY_DN10391_c0_g1_i1.p1  ORF type:complete len:645 (+),score=142.51 TRINITY_DN10391_c0_g1_i1:484-2418(+)
MIVYDNRDTRFLLLRQGGSLLFSRYVLLPATISTLICFVLLAEPSVGAYCGMSSTMAQIYATIISFAIVFRTQMALGRFFSGVEHIQEMYSKWRDACITIQVFIDTSIVKHAHNARNAGRARAREIANVVEELRLSKARLLHWISLLCACTVLNIQHGRDEDWSLAGELRVSETRMMPDNRLIGVGSEGSAAAESRRNSKGERSRAADEFLPEAPHLDMERARWRRHVQVLGEVTTEERDQLMDAQEAVHLVMSWILIEVSDLSMAEILLSEPPLVTRVYQEFSNGMLAYFKAMQIQAVPFPFPFAQVINYTLYGFFFFCPFIVIQIVESRSLGIAGGVADQIWPALLLNFMACTGYAALNEISIELEDPFGDDQNDFPIAVQQWAAIGAIEDAFFAVSIPKDLPSAAKLAPEDPAASPEPSRGLPAVEPILKHKYRELRAAVEGFTEELQLDVSARARDLDDCRGRFASLLQSLERGLAELHPEFDSTDASGATDTGSLRPLAPRFGKPDDDVESWRCGQAPEAGPGKALATSWFSSASPSSLALDVKGGGGEREPGLARGNAQGSASGWSKDLWCMLPKVMTPRHPSPRTPHVVASGVGGGLAAAAAAADEDSGAPSAVEVLARSPRSQGRLATAGGSAARS